jgi:hypothetical protein
MSTRSAAVGLLIVTMLSAAARIAFGSEHPGNIYVAGEAVRVSVPQGWTDWRAVDVDGEEVGAGAVNHGVAELGKLPIGYYELRPKAGGERVTAGVVAKSTPVDDTPVALDAAMSWFYSEPEQIKGACTLAKLAGVRWVRDRASWPELQPQRGQWAGGSRYERSMRIQHEEGLKILQVNHASPPWASTNGSHFPEDLRDVYAFYKGLATRWRDLADAIEPWNEPDIIEFGGHTGCEIASFQKAAYLALKAADPDKPVCATVFAIDRPETLDEYGANEVYPYFDRYDLHHYIKFPDYPRAYGRHRAISAGRPMWTTEFNLPVIWADEKTKEPSDEELRFQSNRVGKAFALALHEGMEKGFYFILGDYVERNLQYGIIHKDFTPRPAYVAFAAVGRLLNGAKPIGRVNLGDDKLFAYAFATQVDGEARETIVAWSETQPTVVEVANAERGYDVYGRDLSQPTRPRLARETVFIVLPPGGSKGLKIEPPPAKPPRLEKTASPLVLQLIGKTDFKHSAFVLDETRQLKLVAYNFGDKPARGTLRVEGGRLLKDPGEFAIGAGDQKEVTIIADGDKPVTVRMEGPDPAIVSARVSTTHAN